MRPFGSSRILFLVSASLFSLAFESPENAEIIFKKPSPCHEVARYRLRKGTLQIYLRAKEGVLCPQVITREKLTLREQEMEKVRRVEVYVGDKLWQEFRR